MEVSQSDRTDNRTNIRTEKDSKYGDFKEFTKSYNSLSFSQRDNRVPKLNVPDEERRQLRGQMAGITEELSNLPTLSDTDRRVLSISRAVAYLLAGR
jgi:hypothetical protein